ncbi:hypothetical protein LEP1GSC188_3018 [Leptospira weilii serovar Topaz str. LT2116]|uniref:Uncharacterized protein n=1 Tax=Leptospira weilii serovar Topaz str. LT2116 TaxID=1088540 RepID=M3ENU9_9LEPT|nr:hypothetical protein LEP1GSC188_3018 [Leptospira weilii serovar Topaz str. LT2116]
MSQNHSILSDFSRIAAIVPTFWDRLLFCKYVMYLSEIMKIPK